ESENQDFRIMLVRNAGERNWRKLPSLQPMDCGGVNCDGFFRRDIRPVLHVIMLSLLLGFQPKPCQPPQILLSHSFVDSSTSPNTLPIIVGDAYPPIGLALDISQNNV